MNNSSSALAVSVDRWLLAPGGCASQPTTADLMRQHASDAQAQAKLRYELASDRGKGRELVKAGRRRVEAGEEQVKSAKRELESGQDAIERGRRETAEGNALIDVSERRFHDAFPELDIESGS